MDSDRSLARRSLASPKRDPLRLGLRFLANHWRGKTRDYQDVRNKAFDAFQRAKAEA